MFADKRQEQERDEVEAIAPGLSREPGTHRPRAGKEAWSIEAARDHDLRGESCIAIAKRLEHHDWEFAHPERSKRAETRVREGRQLLYDRGAWPWALEVKGRLPARWWEEERFAQALAKWWEDAILETLSSLFRTVEIASTGVGADDQDVMARSASSWEAARRAFRDFCRSQVSRGADAA